jgi:hypothetical protein
MMQQQVEQGQIKHMLGFFWKDKQQHMHTAHVQHAWHD